MAKFTFRLDKLLDYRRLQEKWAKDDYLVRRARRLEAETEAEEIADRRVVALAVAELPTSMETLTSRQAFVDKLEDDERAQRSVIGVLESEEDMALEEWLRARQESDALLKLREKAQEEWAVVEARRVQNELDEWAVTRRVS
jgi:flagellar export protein FliJ